MEDSKALFCSSKFPWASKRISLKSVDNLGTHPQKGSPALLQTLALLRASIQFRISIIVLSVQNKGQVLLDQFYFCMKKRCMCSLLHKYYAPQMMLLTTKCFCWNSIGCYASFSVLQLYTYHDQKSVFYLSVLSCP